jgi:hypothetical protein
MNYCNDCREGRDIKRQDECWEQDLVLYIDRPNSERKNVVRLVRFTHGVAGSSKV